jgi:hypothetical protein
LSRFVTIQMIGLDVVLKPIVKPRHRKGSSDLIWNVGPSARRSPENLKQYIVEAGEAERLALTQEPCQPRPETSKAAMFIEVR